MATMQELEEAMRVAYARGDMANAKVLAQAYVKAKEADVDTQRERVSSGATLQFGPWDTGVKIPQWLDEGLAGAGRRAMQIGTLGNNPMKDESSDRLLDASGAATAGAALTDMAALTGGGLALRAAGAAPQLMSRAPGVGRAVQSAGQAMFAPQTVRGAAGMGGAYSALTTEGGLNDRAAAGTFGLGAGALGAAVPKAFAGAVAPQVSDDVADLAARGVRMTPGQMAGGKWNLREQKLMSVPLIGDKVAAARGQSIDDFATAAYNEALAPIGRMVRGTGRDAVKSAYQQVDDVYSKAIPKAVFHFDVEFDQGANAIRSRLKPDQVADFDWIVNQRILSGVDPKTGLTGDKFKEVSSFLKTQARGLKTSPDQFQRNFGEALQDLEDLLMDVASKYTPKRAMNAINRADMAYAKLERVGGAAGMLGAKEGHFTPSQLLSQIRAKSSSPRQMDFRKGEALMQNLAEQADPVLSTRFPNSGTPDRLMQAGGLAALVSGLMTEPVTTLGAAGGAYLGGNTLFSEPARRAAQWAMTHGAPNAVMEEAARLTRLAAPYTAGVGMMFAPTIYSGQ